MNYETKKEIEQILLDEHAHISHGEYIFEELNEVYIKAQAFDDIQEHYQHSHTPQGVKVYFVESKIELVKNELEEN